MENGKGKGKEKKKGREMREKEVKREKGDAKTKTETERENKGILRHIKRHKPILSLNLTDFTLKHSDFATLKTVRENKTNKSTAPRL